MVESFINYGKKKISLSSQLLFKMTDRGTSRDYMPRRGDFSRPVERLGRFSCKSTGHRSCTGGDLESFYAKSTQKYQEIYGSLTREGMHRQRQ